METPPIVEPVRASLRREVRVQTRAASRIVSQAILLLDSVGHRVEGPRHLAELVGTLEPDPLRALPGGQRAGRPGELARRCRRSARQHDAQNERREPREDPPEQQQPVHRRPEGHVLGEESDLGEPQDRGPDDLAIDPDGKPLLGAERPAPHHLPVQACHLSADPGRRIPDRVALEVDESHRAVHQRE